MIYSLLADLAVLLHFCFVLFVVLGGFLVLRWPRYVWLHLPAAVWGALIEFQGWICPLTHLENRWRRAAGERGYEGGFVEHYLMPVLYPEGLTRNVQIVLGLLVIALNVAIYARVFVKRKKPFGAVGSEMVAVSGAEQTPQRQAVDGSDSLPTTLNGSPPLVR